MKMTSVAPGTPTFPVEVTNISQHGFWLLLEGELFLPFAAFPWFKAVAVGKILHVELKKNEKKGSDPIF